MRFPNAFSGVKKIYLAEILSIIALVISLISLFVLASAGVNVNATEAVDVSGVSTGTLAGSVGLMLATGIVSLVGFILQLVGVIQGKKDEEGFNAALVCIVIGIAVNVIGSAVNSFAKFADNISSIMNSLSMYFILTAIASLAGKLMDRALESSTLKARNILAAGIILTEVVKLILELTNQTVTNGVAIVSAIAVVIQLIAYIYYLKILSRAKKALAK